MKVILRLILTFLKAMKGMKAITFFISKLMVNDPEKKHRPLKYSAIDELYFKSPAVISFACDLDELNIE